MLSTILGLVPEFDRAPEPALGDRASIRVVQANPPGRPVRGVSCDSLPGLRHDLPGGIEQFGQVVDRTSQPPTPAPRRRIVHTALAQFVGLCSSPAQRLFRVDQQPLGLVGGGGGQPGELAGDPHHGGLCLVAAGRRTGPQLRPDLVRSPPGCPRAIAQPGARRATGGLNPLAGRGDPANGLGQQPRIGRIGHVRRHHRGIDTYPIGAQQLRFGRLGQ